MCLRRARSHKMGISNIDFRTKRDKENLAIFQPWQYPKFFGTMGYKCYKNSTPLFKKLFYPSNEINTQRDIVNDYPDPRYFTSVHFYKKNKISLNRRSFFNNERVANLDESFKGKEIFNGDSMNIAEIMRIRKGKHCYKLPYKSKEHKKANFSLEDRKIQEEKIEKLIKDKKKENNTATQETQLVKINLYKDKENTVNLKKIKEIRDALRRRYGNRKNLSKAFKLWAATNYHTITVDDAYKMINSLYIPINYDEARLFIASASNLGNDYLNFEEFSNLIHDPIEMNFENDNKEILNNENDIEKIKNNLIEMSKQKYDSINIEKLKDFISERISLLNKNIKKLSEEKYSFKKDDIPGKNIDINLIDFNKFLKGILDLRPSDHFGKEEYIKKIFDEYKNEEGLLDMKYFGEKLYENNTKEFMTKFKNKNIDICKEQYNFKFNKLNNFLKENKDKLKSFYFQKKKDLDNQILERKNYKDKKLEEQKKFEQQLNSTIPSTKWIYHVYKNRREHFNYLNKVEQSFSVRTTNKPNNKLITTTRFSSVPPWKNTAEILVGDEKSGSYISEQDRFKIYKEISKEDKEKKFLISLRKHNRIKKVLKKVEDNLSIKTYAKSEKDIYANMEKNRQIALYNEDMKKRNLMVE